MAISHDINTRINRAIRIWQRSRKADAHMKFQRRLGQNVRKLLKEKKDLETEDSTG